MFHLLGLYLLNAYDMHGIVLFICEYPEHLESKKMPHSFAACLDYHLVESAPSSPWWWIITIVVFIGLRKIRDVNLVSAASIFPILWRNAFVFIRTMSHQFFSGEKTVVFWIYCRTEIQILLLLRGLLNLCSPDIDEPLFDPAGWG